MWCFTWWWRFCCFDGSELTYYEKWDVLVENFVVLGLWFLMWTQEGAINLIQVEVKVKMLMTFSWFKKNIVVRWVGDINNIWFRGCSQLSTFSQVYKRYAFPENKYNKNRLRSVGQWEQKIGWNLSKHESHLITSVNTNAIKLFRIGQCDAGLSMII